MVSKSNNNASKKKLSSFCLSSTYINKSRIYILSISICNQLISPSTY